MEEPIINVGIGEFDELNFCPTADGNIVINDVEIGKQFHWNKREKQRFNGKFTVKGQIDSATMANLFIGEDIVIPIVLEEGEISVDLKAEDLVWGGTELNETLYKFFKSRDSLQTQLRDIQKMEYEMTVNGVDEQTINQRLMAEMQKVSAKEDVLTTSFIKSHYNDALGVGVFVMLLSNMQYPVMTPQIEDILTTAPDAFKQHKLVKKYQEDAKQFSEQQNLAK